MSVPVGLTIEDFEKYGRALVATQPFKKGDVVISERPLQEVDPQTVKLFGTAAARMLEYACADPETQNKVHAMFMPDLKNPGGLLAEEHVRVAFSRATDAAELFPDALSEHSQEDLVKAQLAWVFNGHEFFGNMALFEWGSKLTHSCTPNTEYRTFLGGEEGRGTHVAIRDITPGELILTSYINRKNIKEHGISPMPVRRKVLLESKLFVCSCDTCTTGVDSSRRLPCPSCGQARGKDGLLVEQVDWRTLSALEFRLEEQWAASPWICAACQATFEDTADAVFGDNWAALKKTVVECGGSTDGGIEKALQDLVVSVAEKLEGLIKGGATVKETEFGVQRLRTLHKLAMDALGGRHWVPYRAAYTLCEYYAAALSSGDASVNQDECVEILTTLPEIIWLFVEESHGVDAPPMLHFFVNACRDALLTVSESSHLYPSATAACALLENLGSR